MEKRTSQKSKEQYENRWGEALETIKKDITNKNKSLSEILDNLLKDKVSTRFNQNFYFDFYKKIGIPIKRGQPPEKRLVVQNGKYAVAPLDTILDHKYIEILAKYILENKNRIDYVVELGSGIGRKLFMLAVLAGLISFLALFAYGMPFYYKISNKRGDGKILIGAKYAYINGYFHNWDFLLSGLSKVKAINKPFYGINLVYYYTDRTLQHSEELFIPVNEDIDIAGLITKLKELND